MWMEGVGGWLSVCPLGVGVGRAGMEEEGEEAFLPLFLTVTPPLDCGWAIRGCMCSCGRWGVCPWVGLSSSRLPMLLSLPSLSSSRSTRMKKRISGWGRGAGRACGVGEEEKAKVHKGRGHKRWDGGTQGAPLTRGGERCRGGLGCWRLIARCPRLGLG